MSRDNAVGHSRFVKVPLLNLIYPGRCSASSKYGVDASSRAECWTMVHSTAGFSEPKALLDLKLGRTIGCLT